MSKQMQIEIKRQIREYFVEQYTHYLQKFEHHFGDNTNITRTTKVFSYKKYLKVLSLLLQTTDMKTILDYVNTKWAKNNDGAIIYIDENNSHHIFDCNQYVEWSSLPVWEMDVDKWLDQKVEEMYQKLYD